MFLFIYLKEKFPSQYEDRHLVLVHLIILFNGFLGPVLHLLSDDLLCSQGLVMLSELCECFSTTNGWLDSEDFNDEKAYSVNGILNFAYEEDDDDDE